MDREFLEQVLKVSGEAESGVKDILPEWYTEDELRKFLSNSIRSKIHSDGISRELEMKISDTATLPDDTNEPDYPDSPNGDDVIVRKYFEISKFVSFLRSGIWFSRLDLFDDNYEGHVPEEIIRDRMDSWEFTIDEEGPPFDVRDMFRAEDDVVRKQSFVSCWRYGGKESSVFWDAYIGDQNGVAVQTTLEKLESAMESADQDILIGKVDYKNYKGTRERFASDSIGRVFHKRFAFEDEQELRLLARQRINDHSVNWKGSKKFDVSIDADPGFNVTIDPDDLIEKVILPPSINERQITEVINLMDYHGISAEVWKSVLDVHPWSTAPVRVTGPNRGEVTRSDMKQDRKINKSNYVKKSSQSQ